MDVKEKLDQMFREVKASAGPYDLPQEFIQKEYLVDGEMKEWKGEFKTVYSPICEMAGEQPQRKVIGAYPLMTEEAAMEVLESSLKDYDHGRGVWPAMTLEERIQCMEKFLFEMAEVKGEVARWIMWEIGKTLGDATKEFDRNVDYIRDTIQALKDLDRQSSRFVLEQGILGLEAKNAAVVLEDADLELAVRETILGALTFNGQRCTALKILYVHRNILEESRH